MSGRIKVKGTGRLFLKPDSIKTDLKLETIDKDYSEAVKKSSEKLQNLYEHIGRTGLKKDLIRLSDFTVNAKYDGKTESNGNYKKMFSGFSVVQRLSVEFIKDMNLFSYFLNQISESKTECDINIEFTVKDKETPKKELLKAAVKDASEKAEIIAMSAGKKIKDIISIEYGGLNGSLISPTRFNLTEAAARGACTDGAYADINPEDIFLTDTVMTEWEIE